MRDQILLLVTATLTGTAVAGGSTLILDDFDADPNNDAGGPRTVSSIIVDNPFGQPSNFNIDPGFNFGGDAGSLVFNSGIGVRQQGSVVWNNDGAGLNLDAAALGLIGFEIDFLLIDQAFDMQVVLGTDNGGTASYVVTVNPGDTGTFAFGLGDFNIGGGFDPADVDSIEILFNVKGGTASLDFIATEFRAVVPTPGALAILGIGGIVAFGRRRA